MRIQLSDHFSYGKIIKFTLPTIAMMIISSIYGVVDGFFVSNLVGKTPFAAVNLIMPYIMIFSTVGFIFGTGGSAIVAKTMGEGEKEKANRHFSLFVYVSAALGVVFAFVGIVAVRPVAVWLGAEGRMLCCMPASFCSSSPLTLSSFCFNRFFPRRKSPDSA